MLIFLAPMCTLVNPLCSSSTSRTTYYQQRDGVKNSSFIIDEDRDE